MAPRAFGALFALLAALAFAVALVGGTLPKFAPIPTSDVTMGWWDGRPTVDGKVLERKLIKVGLVHAYGCNLGETVTCDNNFDTTSGLLELAGKLELVGLGLITITTIVLMLSLW